MANVLILGGGFGGVVAAERLAKTLGPEHQITLVSRSRRFVFYPALVRLAFGKCEPDDITYDLREAMLDRRISFIEAEVARVDPIARRVVLAGGEVAGDLSYDYLIFALGHRLATENVTGFFEHAHHLLNVEAALKFGEAVRGFKEGRAIIGYCQGARLAVPVYETAFALARLVKERGEREHTRITIVSPETPGDPLGGMDMAGALRNAFDSHYIEFLPNFPIRKVTASRVETGDGMWRNYNLLMLVPPFCGAPAVIGMGITDEEGYIKVESTLRVSRIKHMYAVGDCVNFSGPKMGHMAVRQGEVAAANVAAELSGRAPQAQYDHEVMMVIDEGGRDSIYLHKGLWDHGEGSIRQGRFWSWAKRMQERYWEYQHS
jgi:sulfide:quinone oxidoreductase